MARRLRFTWAPDARSIAEVAVSLPELSHIDLSRVFFVRSHGSTTTAIARVHALPPVWRFVLGLNPLYAVELVSERYDRLPLEEKVRTIVHELLHIPRSMGGGLRPHRWSPALEEELARRVLARLPPQRNR